MKISLNQHYKFGYDNINDFSQRKNEHQQYTVSFGQCSRIIKSFKEESIIAAKEIQKAANGQSIYISSSGGIDSEYVANIFLEAQIPFEIATVRFKNGYNDHDFNYVKQFCEKNEIIHKVFDLDIKKFLENSMFEYALATKAVTPQFSHMMWMWDQLDGFIVSGTGDPILRRSPCTKEFFHQSKETVDCMYRYFFWRGRCGAPGFFLYTPEMLLSFIMEPEITNLLMFGHKAKVSHVIGTKSQVYNKYFFFEPREEHNGFEFLLDLDNYYREELRKLIPGGESKYKISINNLLNQLWPNAMTQDGGGKYMPQIKK